ncbi:polymer-forming cytoskeletal protein [Paenibacillus sp. GCM10027626]|uniref:polymer-forming cytoskeletal protein n=1 Tax=Paenibacillus sp. GCM10027626 TaxID=3273411 RepID=UPI003632257C
MTGDTRPDLKIIGVGGASGGSFRHVTIDGVGKVDGGLQCEQAVINGVATIRGEIAAEHLDLNGKMSVQGNLVAAVAAIEGHIKVSGKLECDQVKLSGIMKLQGDCEAEFFTARGSFEITGMLNAGEIDIILHGPGEAVEIGAERIRVSKSDKQTWSKWLKWLIPSFNPHLTAAVIEGDEVQLEATSAKVVRGNRIMIGADCSIGRVEYRTELIIHPNAKVAEKIQY